MKGGAGRSLTIRSFIDAALAAIEVALLPQSGEERQRGLHAKPLPRRNSLLQYTLFRLRYAASRSLLPHPREEGIAWRIHINDDGSRHRPPGKRTSAIFSEAR